MILLHLLGVLHGTDTLKSSHVFLHLPLDHVLVASSTLAKVALVTTNISNILSLCIYQRSSSDKAFTCFSPYLGQPQRETTNIILDIKCATKAMNFALWLFMHVADVLMVLNPTSGTTIMLSSSTSPEILLDSLSRSGFEEGTNLGVACTCPTREA